MIGSARIIRGNALNLPIADNTVDAVITSPPYFGLRAYQDGGETYEGQIGAEPTPAEFVDALIAATREMVRVLKPSGSIFVNLGDKYAGSHAGGGYSDKSTLAGFTNANTKGRTMDIGRPKRIGTDGAPTKSLIGIPWRYALRCIDDLGLILRAELIWSKPNGLPESVTDRVRRSHETWFHFVRSPRYYSAVDEIREEHAGEFLSSGARNARYKKPGGRLPNEAAGVSSVSSPQRKDGGVMASSGNLALGKLPGSVWTIPTQPLQVPAHLGIDHFAAYPCEWPRRLIQGWCPREVCSVCGEGRRPATESQKVGVRAFAQQYQDGSHGQQKQGGGHAFGVHRITGYACACPDTTALSTPGLVLDPFGGTGTTALVAKVLGRNAIGVDLSADYCRLATWRTNDPGELARAAQVEKPDPVHPDQLDLFEDIA